MYLSTKEIEALESIDRRNTATKVFGWGLLAFGAVFFANDAGADWFASSEASLSVVFLMIGFFLLSATYFQTTPNDRLLELLKRYVNSDAEALKQITEARGDARAT